MSQEKIDQEHFDKMGKYILQSTLCSNIWFSITAEIARDLAKDGLDQEGMAYGALRKYISDIREFDRRYKPKNKKIGSDAMDVSALQPGSNVAAESVVENEIKKLEVNPSNGAQASAPGSNNGLDVVSKGNFAVVL